jgi:hypothetical protein
MQYHELLEEWLAAAEVAEAGKTGQMYLPLGPAREANADIAEIESRFMREIAALEDRISLRLDAMTTPSTSTSSRSTPPAHTPRATEKSAVILEIMKMHSEGLSLRKIAETLEAKGVPSLGGGKWASGTISKLIKKEKERDGA